MAQDLNKILGGAFIKPGRERQLSLLHFAMGIFSKFM